MQVVSELVVEKACCQASEVMLAARPFARRDAVSFPALLTLVLWLTCLGVGVMGFVLPYTRPRAKPLLIETLVTEKIMVELTDEPLAVGETTSAAAMGAVDPADGVPQLEVPAAVAVAEPSADIAFPIPVQGAVEIVDLAGTGYVGAPASDAMAGVAGQVGGTGLGGVGVQTLTFGQGDGRQPAPEYPHQSVRSRQEGTVLVRMLVGNDGRVISAEAYEQSPWPLLDDAAVRCVRYRWRFRPGPMRSYEVPIRFQLRG